MERITRAALQNTHARQRSERPHVVCRVSKYRLLLPTEDELRVELERDRFLLEDAQEMRKNLDQGAAQMIDLSGLSGRVKDYGS